MRPSGVNLCFATARSEAERALAASEARDGDGGRTGVLALNFVLPLAQPVLAEADGFSFAVSDPSYFIAFDLAKEQPIRLSEGAPAGCQANIVAAEQDKAELERLGQAFQKELGGAAMGVGIAKSVAVSCPKS